MAKTIFENAQKLKEQHPETFEAPTREELDSIQEGSSVKVCTNDERFWTVVTKIDGDNIKATVDNDLVRTKQHGLRYGDVIEFTKDNIYLIYN